MDICFLFAKQLTDEGCIFLKLSENGKRLVPPSPYSFEEIRTLQKGCKTILVEACEYTSVHSLELSWLPERKARTAIPFALEERLAANIEGLHFAFDKLHYQDGHYLVLVISLERMNAVLERLKKEGIQYELYTSDWFALLPQELLVNESTLLIHQTDFKGALTGDLALTYLNNHPLNPPLLFQDSQLALSTDVLKKEESSLTFIAERLLKTKPLNLCQGNFQQGNESASLKQGAYIAAGLFCVWLFSIVLTNLLSLQSLNVKTAQVDQDIAVIYREFFPKANQVISPKFRIQQLISGRTKTNDAHFWFLLNQLAKSMVNNSLSIEQLRYQNQALNIRLVSPDFGSIEQLKNKMKGNELKVRQTEAQTRDQQVVATLELT